MAEYLAPGVYVEEVSFRAKSIEGVSTTVTGFLGPTRYGPVGGEPELLTSFADFERIYGGIDGLAFAGEEEQVNFMAHAVRAFFDNGGSKLYVTRVYEPEEALTADGGRASAPVGSPLELTLRARFPGSAGDMRVVFTARASANVLSRDGASRLASVRANDVVLVQAVPNLGSPLAPPPSTVREGLYDVADVGGELRLDDGTTQVRVSELDPAQRRVHLLTLSVRAQRVGRFEDELAWGDLSPHPQNRNALTDLFAMTPTSRQRYLTVPFAIETAATSLSGADLATALLGADALEALGLSLYSDRELAVVSPGTPRPRPADLERAYTLSGGSDGRLPSAESYRGEAARRGDDGEVEEGTGLETFADVEEISMVAAPGATFNYAANPARANQVVQLLIAHCQVRMRYRVAILDAPDDQVVSEARDFRGQFDSTHAALYYPWITVLDPMDPDGRREIEVPPSGFVAGICARSDVLHGVAKAPANEVALGAIGLEALLNKAQQDVLNPLGVNCFRFFEGRGYRLWGARTISSDPEWKYFNVRRYFAYLEHSIDRGTQWAVFENNGDALWANVRRTVEDFLVNEWRNGALLGRKAEEAFFVRCDRSTMSQNDLDNGRLICLIGVSVLKPAEFVIFRIGQMTADATR